jgi:SAM-dependent methyltransferase
VKHDAVRRFLLELGRDKDVLMLGPLGRYECYRQGMLDYWDFKFLAGISRTILGLDINADLVRVASADGFNVRTGDAESFLDETGARRFDLIYAPDLIEHLGNPLKCLECCAAAIRPGGLIVMETPNPIGINTIVKALVTGGKDSLEEHTCWIDKGNAKELGRRAGLSLQTQNYTPINPYGFWKGLRTRIYRAISSVRPGLACKAVFIYRRMA